MSLYAEKEFAEIKERVGKGELSTDSEEYKFAKKKVDKANAEVEQKEEQAVEDVSSWTRKQQALDEEVTKLEELQKQFNILKI